MIDKAVREISLRPTIFPPFSVPLEKSSNGFDFVVTLSFMVLSPEVPDNRVLVGR